VRSYAGVAGAVPEPRRAARAIAPLRLQLLELALAALAFYLAVHLGSATAAVLVVAGVLLGGLALVTAGPLGVSRKVSPMVNLVVLGVIGIASMLTPFVIHGARSTTSIVVFEAGGIVIGLALAGVIGRARAGAVATTPEGGDRRDDRVARAARQHAFRAAGRIAGRAGRAGRAGASFASDVPRTAGRFVGARRATARSARKR